MKKTVALLLAIVLLAALLPGIALPAKALTQDEAELYIPVVQRILEAAIDAAGDDMIPFVTRGILYDVDDDGVTELILSYPYTIQAPWYWEYAYGVYDIEHGQLVTRAEDVTFGASAAAAGSDGYTGVALYKGKPVLITCAEGGETSLGPGAKYPAWKCNVTAYSFDSFREIIKIGVETTHEEILFYVDGREVSEQSFLEEMKNFTYLKYSLYDTRVYLSNTIDKMPLDELLKELEKKAAEMVPETTQAPEPETTEASAPTDPPAAKPTEGKQDAPAATKPMQKPQDNPTPTKPAQKPQEEPQEPVEKQSNWIYIVIGVIGLLLIVVILIKAWKLVLILVLIAALALGALFLIQKIPVMGSL